MQKIRDMKFQSVVHNEQQFSVRAKAIQNKKPVCREQAAKRQEHRKENQ